jgi:drug/metabolite transporter superfamily protein YnfA
MRLPGIAWLIFLAAAILEVGGDAIVRKGMRGGGLAFMALGFLMLGTYGVVVNLVPWDFSKLLGVYVAVFAAVSVLVGRFFFHEAVPNSTWLGVAIIIVGGLVVQFGASIKG